MGDEICYPSNSVETVYNIFHSRYKLYKNYYFDVVNKSIEIMVCDILKKTSDYFKFVEAC
jgi:HD superfamily phosphohydrolase